MARQGARKGGSAARTAGKKAAALTPEEKLQQALVPVEEQPYKVPENWCWVYTLVLFNIEYGKGISTKQLTEEGYPVFGANGQIGYYDKYMFEHPKALMSCRGAYSGVMNKTLPYSFVTSNSLIMNCKQIDMAPSYICYMFSALDTSKLITGTAQPQVTVQSFTEYPIPLPPLPEQQRIVDRIESLFAKLDEAKEKAQAVVDGFELRKSAILHQAFTGELTKEWRREHGVGMESWERKTVSSICGSLKYGTAKKSEKTGTVVVIRMGNLQQGEIDWTDLAYSNDEDDIQKYRLEAGDVLFNRTNSAALVGKTSIYRGEYPAIYAGYLIKLDYNHDIVIGDFFNYALNTNDAKEYCNSVKTDGVNQSNINAQKIGAYKIPVPKIEEQKEIVVILQKLLSAEQQAKDAAEAVLNQIDTMKKAILARAFRGELGTNNPAEESAEELLKTVLNQNGAH
jgi:type I restriction enzyme S subunit